MIDRPQTDNGERKNHLWAFAVTGFFLVVSVWSIAVNELYVYLAAYLWFGFIYGMCLQGGRFCFSSAFRDLFAVGVPRMLVGIVIATVLFGVSASFLSATGMSAGSSFTVRFSPSVPLAARIEPR